MFVILHHVPSKESWPFIIPLCRKNASWEAHFEKIDNVLTELNILKYEQFMY